MKTTAPSRKLAGGGGCAHERLLEIGDEVGRVAVVDLLRARTRRFDATFVLGLEEGSLPRRSGDSPFLDDDARRELDERGARLARASTWRLAA